MIAYIIRWMLTPMLAAVLAGLLGGPWLGFDPLIAAGFALGASLVVGYVRPAIDALLLWGAALALCGWALSVIPRIPPLVEWCGVAAVGVAAALLTTLSFKGVERMYARVQR